MLVVDQVFYRWENVQSGADWSCGSPVQVSLYLWRSS